MYRKMGPREGHDNFSYPCGRRCHVLCPKVDGKNDYDSRHRRHSWKSGEDQDCLQCRGYLKGQASGGGTLYQYISQSSVGFPDPSQDVLFGLAFLRAIVSVSNSILQEKT